MTLEQKIIKNKVGLLKLAEALGSVNQGCKVTGYSKDSLYQFKEPYEKAGEEGRYIMAQYVFWWDKLSSTPPFLFSPSSFSTLNLFPSAG